MHMSVLVDVTTRPRPPPLRTSNKPRLVPRDDTIFTFTTLDLLQIDVIVTSPKLLLPHSTTSRVAATCAWRQPLRGMLGMLSPTLCIRCGEQPHPWKSDRDVVVVR